MKTRFYLLALLFFCSQMFAQGPRVFGIGGPQPCPEIETNYSDDGLLCFTIYYENPAKGTPPFSGGVSFFQGDLSEQFEQSFEETHCIEIPEATEVGDELCFSYYFTETPCSEFFAATSHIHCITYDPCDLPENQLEIEVIVLQSESSPGANDAVVSVIVRGLEHYTGDLLIEQFWGGDEQFTLAVGENDDEIELIITGLSDGLNCFSVMNESECRDQFCALISGLMGEDDSGNKQAESIDHASNLHLWPNPFQNEISIESKDPSNIKSIEIHDHNGQQLYQRENINFDSNSIILDDINIPTGTYLIRVQNEKNTEVRILIKE